MLQYWHKGGISLPKTCYIGQPEKNSKWYCFCPFWKRGKTQKKALYNRENIESRYVNHRLHLYSKQLIDFCIEQQASTLILKNQEDKIGIAKEQKFVLRNWSYYELQAKIKYKAEKAGIELIIGQQQAA